MIYLLRFAFIVLASATISALPSRSIKTSTTISSSVANLTAGSTASVFLESDYSRRWQPFEAGVTATSGKAFAVPVSSPGYYWLVAFENGATGEPRRGACLVYVDEALNVTLKPLPRLKVGNKWSGNQSARCSTEGIVLLTNAQRKLFGYSLSKLRNRTLKPVSKK